MSTSLPSDFRINDYIGGEPITVDGNEVGRILERLPNDEFTVWIDPKAAPFHGYSPELDQVISVT